MEESEIHRLKREFGNRKKIPAKYEEPILVALSAYPELKDIDITFKLVRKHAVPYGTSPSVGSILKPPALRKYLITLLEEAQGPEQEALFRNLSPDEQQAVIAHQLVHVTRYQKCSSAKLFRTLFGYVGRPETKRKMERGADIEAIERGFGKELLAHAVHLREIPGYVEKRPEINKYYLKPDEIRLRVENLIGKIKVLRGPNIWSAEHLQLLVLKLNGELAGTLEIGRIQKSLPVLFPSIQVELERIAEQHKQQPLLYFASAVALTARELQMRAIAGPGLYWDTRLSPTAAYAIIEYADEETGIKASRLAAHIVLVLSKDGAYDDLADDIKDLKRLYERNAPGPSSQAILSAAEQRDIPINKRAAGGYITLGYGKYTRKIAAAMTDHSTWMSVELAGDKNLTKDVLEEAMLPVPPGIVITSTDELKGAFERLGKPLVVKPLDGHQGKGITTDITTEETLLKAFQAAKKYSRKIIVEKHLQGSDYRFLVINYKLAAVAKRSPALVTGDGQSSVQQLIDKVNSDPRRGHGHSDVLTKIVVDDITKHLLKISNLTLHSVLPKGKVLILKDTANLSTGGTAEDVTDEVHPENVRLAERVARLVGLDICGIDIMAPDVSTPLSANGGAIIEVNAAPGLRMHIAPSGGTPRPVGKAIVDMMFPGNSDGRIPLVAITGTNGKTTTSRIMAHVAQNAGYCTGFTSTDGIYINGEQVVTGDCSGPRSSNVVLQDPLVEFAVLECARGGILRSGLAFDKCDVGIVTNVAADHLGMEDIHTVDDMARVKQVVPLSVKPEGYAILNAALPLVLNMRKDLKCRVALFALDGNNPAIAEHCRNGGMAAFRDEDGFIVVREADRHFKVEQASVIPLTLGGKAGFMIENILPVVLAAYVLKFPLDKVKSALMSFSTSSEHTPGRMNVLDVGDKKVIVDYAHNPHSIKAFSEFIANIEERKYGIITGVGDRRDEDIKEVGELAAHMYDEIIIRIDEDTRGRSPENIADLLKAGVKNVNADIPCRVIPEMESAVRDALKRAAPGSYIIINVDSVAKTLRLIEKLKKEADKEKAPKTPVGESKSNYQKY